MSEDTLKKTEELEDELETEAAEAEEDSVAQGESLFDVLKTEGLVDDTWDDLSGSEKAKYQLVATNLGM